MLEISVIATASLLFATVVPTARAIQQWRIERSRAVYELKFPHGLKAADVINYLRYMSSLMPSPQFGLLGHSAVILGIRATRHGIAHRLTVPGSLAEATVTQLRASIPGIRITPVTNDSAVKFGQELGLRRRLAPLNIPDPAAITTATIASLQPLERGEIIEMQWVIAPTIAPQGTTARHHNRERTNLPEPIRILLDGLRSPEPTEDQIAAAKLKFAEPVFSGICRIGVTAATRKRTRQLIRQVIAPLQITRTQVTRFVRRPTPRFLAAWRLQRGAVPIFSFPLVVNVAELAALIGWPVGSPTLPGLNIGAARQLPPAAAIPRSGHVIGTANFPGASRPVAIGIAESLRHTHVIGPTGSGKSTLLINMAVQDMQAGRGLAVFDPKGDLISDLLERIPAGRENDVVLIDPTDLDRSVGLNILEHSHIGSEVVVDQIVGVFKRLFVGFWGPRTDDVLRSCLLTLAFHPGTTLIDVPVLMMDPKYREKIVGKVDDPVGLGTFWEWYEDLSDKERSQVVGPVLNKLRALLLRKSVRDIFGQSTSSIKMNDVIAENKILLVSLPKGQLGEDTSSLLGSMLVLNLYQAAQLRGALPASKRTPFFCYIDEFQDYLNLPGGVENILAQARGFGFALVLAHQQLAQLSRDVRDAVLANTRSKIVFQTAAADARALADEFDPYLNASDLQNLEPYQAMALVAVSGQSVAPVSIATAPAPMATSSSTVIRAVSAQQFGRDRKDIERYLRARLTGKYASHEVEKQPE